MPTEKNTVEAPVIGVPPVVEEPAKPKAGLGQVVVESPTGSRTAIDEDRAASLKHQGYRVVQ